LWQDFSAAPGRLPRPTTLAQQQARLVLDDAPQDEGGDQHERHRVEQPTRRGIERTGHDAAQEAAHRELAATDQPPAAPALRIEVGADRDEEQNEAASEHNRSQEGFEQDRALLCHAFRRSRSPATDNIIGLAGR
jgi:hypothetical protein